MTERRTFSVPMPNRLLRLHVDSRGFPVPWFVQWFKDGEPCPDGVGEPDFRVVNHLKFVSAVKQRRCWICGELLGVHGTFVIGPMCAVNRVISEPPSHGDCARFSAIACPFLSQPRMRRNEKGLPEDGVPAPGFGLKRNPGVACLWSTRQWRPFRAHAGQDGILFSLGDPSLVEWYANGRPATREEVWHSIETGLPELHRMAIEDGPDAVATLTRYVAEVMPLLPKENVDGGAQPV